MLVDLSNRGLQAFSPGELSSQTGSDATPHVGVTGLNLSHNSLGSVHGLQGFTLLTALDLSFNGLCSLDGGLPLGLVSLNVSHNNVATLRGGALAPLRRLETLNIAHNQLADLHGIAPGAGVPALRHLDASGNQIGTLSGLESCRNLEELRLERNMLKTAAEAAALRGLPRLQTLLVKENPLLLRKREVQALHALLPGSLQVLDAPAPSAVPSTANTSLVSASTAATAVEIIEERHRSANISRETALSRRIAGSSSQRHADPTTTAAPARLRSPSVGAGVGGQETSPVCPRRSLPGEALSPPALQPYNVGAAAPSSSSVGGGAADPSAKAAEAHMLRPALLDRVVGVPAATVPPQQQQQPQPSPGGRARAQPQGGSQTATYEELREQRDHYQRRVGELTKELAALRACLELERENTAVVLCINEQLQQRLQQQQQHSESELRGAAQPLARGEAEESSSVAAKPPPLPPPLAPRQPTAAPEAVAGTNGSAQPTTNGSNSAATAATPGPAAARQRAAALMAKLRQSATPAPRH